MDVQSRKYIRQVSTKNNIFYARYLMSVNLKRFLSPEEHIDHIDNNKLNDELTNLQILSESENKKKYIESQPSAFKKMQCSYCDELFEIRISLFNFKTKRGQKSFCCSRSCKGKLQHLI